MMKKINICLAVVGAICALTFWASREPAAPSVTVNTLYGTFEIDEPVLIDLLESDVLQRLKHIHQYGVCYYTRPNEEEYSRYEHSVGVFALLRRYRAPLDEQIAGLLHDVSHTVFSHVADHIFSNKSWASSYQDDIHDWFLEYSGLSKILEKHGYTAESINPKQEQFSRLERDLPFLCADRIEYNIQGAVKRGIFDEGVAQRILADLRFDDGRWYFISTDSANRLAAVSLFMTENVWGEPLQLLVYSWTADALKRGMEIGLVTLDDIHFSTDHEVWHRLITSTDTQISACMEKILNYDNEAHVCAPNDRDTLVIGKFRGIDPLVRLDQTFQNLSEIDPHFSEEYHRVKDIMRNGWSIKLVEHHTAPSRGLVPWNTERPEWISTAGVHNPMLGPSY